MDRQYGWGCQERVWQALGIRQSQPSLPGRAQTLFDATERLQYPPYVICIYTKAGFPESSVYMRLYIYGVYVIYVGDTSLVALATSACNASM